MHLHHKLFRRSLKANPRTPWRRPDQVRLHLWMLLFVLDLWTKWPSHFLGMALTTNLAALYPAWLRAVGNFLLHH